MKINALEIKEKDFVSLIEKQKILEYNGFRFQSIGYFKNHKIWNLFKYMIHPCILGDEFKEKPLSLNNANFYDEFYKLASKKGCKKSDILLVKDTPGGYWEKMRNHYIVLTNNSFFIFPNKMIEINEKEFFLLQSKVRAI